MQTSEHGRPVYRRTPDGECSLPRNGLSILIGLALVALIALGVSHVVVERATHTALIGVGKPAPDFTLPATTGGTRSLASLRGHPVVLLFVPSVRSALGQAQLRALQAMLPTLRARNIDVLAVSTDERAIQRATARDLHLGYSLLAEAPTFGEHPAGSAYGVYHLPTVSPAPVDANALFVIGADGRVHAEQILPTHVIAPQQILIARHRSTVLPSM